MMRIGEKQRLRVVRKTDFGIYLAAREGDRDMVLLPGFQRPPHRHHTHTADSSGTGGSADG